jgi:hypothetical protein
MRTKILAGVLVLAGLSMVPVPDVVQNALDATPRAGAIGATAACADDCIPIFFPCDECTPSPYDSCGHSQAIIPVEGWRLRQ